MRFHSGRFGVFGALPSSSVLVLFSAFVSICCTASASQPTIGVVSDDGAELVLVCRGAGWSPEPELLWLDAEGNLLPAGPTETVRGADGLYTVSSTVTVEKRHGSTYTCRVQQSSISQATDAHITVADSSFMDLDLSCFLLIIVVVVGGSLGTCVWCRQRQNQTESKPRQKGSEQHFSGADLEKQGLHVHKNV